MSFATVLLSSLRVNSLFAEIQIINFAESRAAEIKALEEQVNNVEGGQKVQQKLPRHMRRRAMSHNIKRLPKKLRALGKKDVCDLFRKRLI